MHVVFQDRNEAGRKLAKGLAHFHGTGALILAIPHGGVPVAAAAAHRLKLEWNVVVVHKLPVPWSPEAGFGAVTADGPVVLNEGMLHGLQMRQDRIADIVTAARSEMAQAAQAFERERPAPPVAGKQVIVLDDGLASGYTMLAAVESLRMRGAERIAAASPVASRPAAAMLEEAADECVFEVVSPAVPFSIADFYINRHELTDEDILELLRSA